MNFSTDSLTMIYGTAVILHFFPPYLSAHKTKFVSRGSKISVTDYMISQPFFSRSC